MKLIYDSDQPSHRIVQFEDKDGALHPAASYKLIAEFLTGERVTLSRWGDEKKRRAQRRILKEAVDQEGGKA